MNKEIRTVTTEGIVQITTVDERWYARPSEDPTTKLPTYDFVPSVTWIANYYPKGIGFYKWLAEHGWDEAEAIKEAAADKGGKVHQAIADLLDGKTVLMDALYPNKVAGVPEPLTVEEYGAILSFAAWWSESGAVLVEKDTVVWNDAVRYAGTLDLLCTIKGDLWLIDFKISQQVFPEHELQVSAYKHAKHVEAKLAILQVGYRRNQRGYKFNEVEDQYDLFLHARAIWAKETAGQSPKQKDYPVSVTLPMASGTASTATERPQNGAQPASAKPSTPKRKYTRRVAT